MRVKTLILSLIAVASFAVFGGTKVIKNGDVLVFMGDSITQYGKDSEAGYLPLVAKGLAANGVNVTWHGVGIAGNTAAQMRARFEKDALSKNPNVVTILAGVNDCSMGWPNNATAGTGPEDVAAMADMAIQAGALPVLFSPTGSSLESFPASVDQYSEEVKKIAQARGVPYGTTHEAFKAYVQDTVNPVIGQTDRGFWCKATCDSLHMDVPGNRIIAIEMLKALGFDSDAELANAAAAWNTISPFYTAKVNVNVTESEYMSIRVAAAKANKSIAEFQEDLFHRGIEIEKQHPAEIAEASGADIALSLAPSVGFVEFDSILDSGRALRQNETAIRSEVGSLPRIVNSGFLAAVRELPVATEADLPSEPNNTVIPGNFTKSIEFTCSGYTGASTLTDFPVAVRLSAGTPTGFSYADMSDSANGSELRFADSTGRSLSYEIESWNPSGTSLVWVKLPSLTKTTKFKMYYGGTAGDTVASKWTWKADYVGVWHMGEASGAISDSTGNGLTGEPFCRHASCQVAGAGLFGQARVNSIPGINSFTGQSLLKVDDSNLLDLGSDFTFSGWINMTANPQGDVGRIASRNYYLPGGTYKPEWELMVSNYTTLKVFAGSTTPVTGTIPSAQNTWVHIAGVFDGTSLKVYANGTKVMDETIAPVQDSNNKMTFGSNDKDCSMGHFVGLFDEFRLRDAVSSADWVKAEYDQSKTTFLTTGDFSEETGDTPPSAGGDEPPASGDDDPAAGGEGEDDPAPANLGWTAETMTANGAGFRTDGTLLYAYARGNYTVNGIPFAQLATTGFTATSDVGVTPGFSGTKDTYGGEHQTGDFANMLAKVWYWEYNTAQPVTVTLRGLTAGKTYLVQIFGHRHNVDSSHTKDMTFSVTEDGETASVIVGDKNDDSDNDAVDYLGGSIIGTYKATGATRDIVITYAGGSNAKFPINAIQVRELNEAPQPTNPIVLGTPAARPSTDYNGSVVTVSFTGDVPAGAAVTAKVMLGGTAYNGTVDAEKGTVTVELPANVVTVGNTYTGTVTLMVGSENYTKDVTLVQGTLVADENASWIRESATSFATTGAWAGEKAAVASGRISVSNATFTASKAAPQAAVVTVESTFVFGDATDEAFNNTSRAGIKVVTVNGTKRYAFKTATGAATNLTVAAKTDSAVRVTVTLDNATHKISYAVDGTSLGQYAMAEKTAGVATVRYEGETDVTSLNGSYVLNGLDTNLAKVGDTEYATVAEALAAGNGQVQLLWDSSWDPAASGDYTFNKAGFNLVIGGSLAYSVKDNGNGTVTVSVTGGDAAVEAPAPTAVTMSGDSVKVGVENVKPNLWYALEKTTDLTRPFVIDATTWTKGSELINGDKELMIALYGSEPQAFYRVVVSTTAP